MYVDMNKYYTPKFRHSILYMNSFLYMYHTPIYDFYKELMIRRDFTRVSLGSSIKIRKSDYPNFSSVTN